MKFKSCLLLALLLIGCHKTGEAPKPPPTVTVSHPVQQMVTDYIELTGTVAPSRSVDLVARVSGYLESANFVDGEYVKAGQLLFLIEPNSYEQQLALAKAALEQAQLEYQRQLGLIKENATSAASVEKWRSQRDQDQAQVEIAKLNLGYTRITAPFSGRIGRRQVDPGNLVGPSVNAKLATLDQIQPIYVYFNLNERDAILVRTMLQKRGTPIPPPPGTMPVFAG
ncbi:MAG TPA: efflux RND transporter periplasmic adaptor subunit, partial [Verrucomicrobiae bacterium]|nr:efflux RND transporter periplasmic adaptor subunit [Verrucomicrobiae bacterium]